MIVVAIIAIAMAAAVPRFWPAIDASTLEGSARRLGNYGRAVMSQSALIGETLIVKIDIDNNEYWTERTPLPDELKQLEEEQGKTGGELSTDLFADMGNANEDQLEQQKERMELRMEQFARQAIESRAQNVKSEEGILEDQDPLFEKDFSLDEDKDKQDWEYRNFLLERTRLPEGLHIESVRFGLSGKEVTKGVAEIEVYPLGLGTPVIFYIHNDSNDYFTIAWDPITTGTHLYEGKEANL